MNLILEKVRTYLILLFLLTLGISPVFAQNTLQVSGTVTDINGLALPGVNIMEKGTGNGTVSNIDGLYTLNVSSGESTLIFSYIGYLTEEIVVANQSIINHILMDDITQLDAVVVIGYGTIKRSELTGAVSVVNTKDLKSMPSTGALGALQGKAAGVRVVSTSGQPGSNPAIWVRGLNTVNAESQPIFIVDGTPVDNINFLNQNDIESIDVLKDASSAAIYGSRASNGVILIKTRRGSMSETGFSKITFDTYTGMVNSEKRPQLLDAGGYFDYRHRVELTKKMENPDYVINPDFADRNAFLDEVEMATGSRSGTDWWSEVVNKAAVTQNYNINFTGGSRNTAYSATANYYNQEGIIKNSEFERYSFNLNLDAKPHNRVDISSNFVLTSQKRNAVGETNLSGGTDGLLSSIYGAGPASPVFRDPDNPAHADYLFGYEPLNPYSQYHTSKYFGFGNPALSIEMGKDNYNKQLRILGGFEVKVNILEGLDISSRISGDFTRINGFGFSPIYAISPESKNEETSLWQNADRNENYISTNLITYQNQFGKHSLNFMTGYEASVFNWEFLNVLKTDTTNWNLPQFRVLNLYANNANIDGNHGYSTLLSYLGRAIYGYDNKYLFNFTVRRDGSSKFASENRWSIFPAFSTGWIFSNENFVSNHTSSWLSFGKIYGGWGQLGNQSIPQNRFLTTYERNPEAFMVIGNERVYGIGPWVIGNPLLRWETAEQTNIGLDLGLFNNRLFVVAEYYIKKNRDLLFKVEAPQYFGFANNDPWQNIGVMVNRGIDIQMTFKKSTGAFKYDITGSFDMYRNRLEDISLMDRFAAGTWRNTDITWIEEGQPVGIVKGYIVEGVFQNQEEIDEHVMSIFPNTRPGDFKYKDVDGNGVLDADDKVVIANPHPDFSFGLNSNFEYKNFDLMLFFQGVYGNDIYDYSGQSGFLIANNQNNNASVLDRAWRAPGTLGPEDPGNLTNDLFGIAANDNLNSAINERFVKDGSYIRLKTLQLGYTLPKDVSGRLKIDNLRIYASAHNLLTFTKYDGLDPEVGSNTVYLMGVDFYTYPQPRTFMLGINLSL